MKLLIFLVFASFIAVEPLAFSKSSQTVQLMGQLLCYGRHTDGRETQVKLLNKRLGVDDQSGVKRVGHQGLFQVSLTVHRSGGFTPVLHVYTDCNDEKQRCQRKLTFPIDKKAINAGIYVIGRVDLWKKQKGEGRHC